MLPRGVIGCQKGGDGRWTAQQLHQRQEWPRSGDLRAPRQWLFLGVGGGWCRERIPFVTRSHYSSPVSGPARSFISHIVLVKFYLG